MFRFFNFDFAFGRCEFTDFFTATADGHVSLKTRRNAERSSFLSWTQLPQQFAALQDVNADEVDEAAEYALRDEGLLPIFSHLFITKGALILSVECKNRQIS